MAIALKVPALLQRAIPDCTSSLQNKLGGSDQIVGNPDLGGLINDQNKDLSKCADGTAELESCDTAPDIKGITGWLNTPGNTRLDLKSLRGKVIHIDFWAYSCINC